MKTIKFWLTAIAMLLCSVATNAEVVFTVDGIEYTVASTDGTCSVSGYDESFGTEVVIPSSVDYRNRTFSVTSIGGYAFRYCSSLTSISIPESVTSIGFSAFEKCSNLTFITIPESVMKIRDSAFKGCCSLTSINIPENSLLTSIEESTFSDCSSLASISIPENVTSIGDYTFQNCTSLKEIIFENGIETLRLGCNDIQPNYRLYVGEGLFYDCPLESVYLGRNLSYSSEYYCGYSPFSYKHGLTTLVIGESVSSIGKYLFGYCSHLTSIILPESVTSIGAWAFNGCSSLTSITISERVTSIGDSAFKGCGSLTSITIPENVTSIGTSAFYGCSSLTSISCLAMTPPTIYEETFDEETYLFAELFIPQGTKEAYQAENGWKDFYFINDTLPNEIQTPTLGYPSRIHDINGHKRDALQPGVNIVDGKKVFIK